MKPQKAKICGHLDTSLSFPGIGISSTSFLLIGDHMMFR